MQTALVIAIVPVVLYFFAITFRDLKTEVKDDMDEFAHRHDHRHVSEAADHAVIAKLQDENARLREQPDENSRPKRHGQRTQQDDTIAMLKESLAKSQELLANMQAEHGAENTKKDAELAAAWQRLTAQAQRLGALSPSRTRSFSPGGGASA